MTSAALGHVIERLRQAAARVAESYGLEVFDIQVRRESIGWVLRVIIDRPGRVADSGQIGPDAADVVGIEDCQRVSRDFSALLDVEDNLTEGIDRGYTLEVSSPGMDRPLRGADDYRRFAGRLAKIVTREPVRGQSHFTGRLVGVDGEDVVMVEGRREHRVPIGLIRRARLEVEF